MGYTIAQKIIKNHLVSGEMIPGAEIGLRIDQFNGVGGLQRDFRQG